MNIQNNLMALNAQRQTQLNSLLLKSSLQRLASGYRINSAADDAAGLAISESMRAQTTGTERAIMNAHDGVSFVQTAEGALGEVHSMLNRLTDLSMQASNGILSDEQRASLQGEADQILSEIDRISGSSNFNGQKILDGSLQQGGGAQPAVNGVSVSANADGAAVLNKSDLTVYDGTNGAAAAFEVDGQSFVLADSANYASAVAEFGQSANVIEVDGQSAAQLSGEDLQRTAAAINSATGNAFEADENGIAVRAQNGNPLQLQVGENGEEITRVSIGNMSSSALGLDSIDFSSAESASQSLNAIRSALDTVSGTRGDLGATQNALDHTISNLQVKSENIQAAESRIRDADMARMLMDFTKRNILQQTGQAMQAHSQMQSQQVLQLLR